VATPKRPDILGRREVDPLDARGARIAALDALARRDHASSELRRKLRDKGYDGVVVDELVERLIAEKLLDDRRYLQNFVAYHAARGQGPNRVRAELRKLGLQTELRSRPITLIDSARHDSWRTGATPAPRFGRPSDSTRTWMQTRQKSHETRR
jgi:regulatory protein